MGKEGGVKTSGGGGGSSGGSSSSGGGRSSFNLDDYKNMEFLPVYRYVQHNFRSHITPPDVPNGILNFGEVDTDAYHSFATYIWPVIGYKNSSRVITVIAHATNNVITYVEIHPDELYAYDENHFAYVDDERFHRETAEKMNALIGQTAWRIW